MTLPRLLCISDVSVEAACAGTVLLYRLLAKFSPEKLQIAEGDLCPSKPARRLPNIIYHLFTVGNRRLLCTRFATAYSTFLCLTAGRRTSQLQRIVREFKPEAILTVAHGYSWITAAKVARESGLPLHLVVHDDWPTTVSFAKRLSRWPGNTFQQVYSQAETRLCISPYMEQRYRTVYGEAGTVIYPSRSPNVPIYETPPERLRDSHNGLVFAYAGGGATPRYASVFAVLADTLKGHNSRLRIHSPLSPQSAATLGLDKPNVELCPIVPSDDLITTLRKEADVLIVPMDFGKQYANNMQLGFPSKLADYTAAGLPILIWGPPYCSAVKWANANPGTAEVVESADVTVLKDAVAKLHRESALRHELGQRALDCGKEYFSCESVTSTFHRAIQHG